MSLYLGKIHYWLFNKIVWFENLSENIACLAQKTQLDLTEIEKEIVQKYGAQLENKNLDEIIDLNNIHGWLQNRIHTSEGRMAAWIQFLLKNDVDAIQKLKKVFEENGASTALEAKKSGEYDNANEIYNCMNDYILDGMPCDRVNLVTLSDENSVAWERRLCVHEDVWSKENVDVKVFYDLRNSWIETFVKNLNSNFSYSEVSEGKYIIKK